MKTEKIAELCKAYKDQAARNRLTLDPTSKVILIHYEHHDQDGAPTDCEWVGTAETENELRLSIRLVERMTAIGYREGYAACERVQLAHQEQ